jgi:hypothetical protein
VASGRVLGDERPPPVACEIFWSAAASASGPTATLITGSGWSGRALLADLVEQAGQVEPARVLVGAVGDQQDRVGAVGLPADCMLWYAA